MRSYLLLELSKDVSNDGAASNELLPAASLFLPACSLLEQGKGVEAVLQPQQFPHPPHDLQSQRERERGVVEREREKEKEGMRKIEIKRGCTYLSQI